MKTATALCYLFCLAAGAFLARFELHTDDTGVEVFLIFFFTFVLGCWHPVRPWQWALLVGPWAPAADLIARMLGKPSDVSIFGGLLAVTALVILVGLVGAYLGAMLRRGIASAGSRA